MLVQQSDCNSSMAECSLHCVPAELDPAPSESTDSIAMGPTPNITDLPQLPLSCIYHLLIPEDKQSLFSTCTALHHGIRAEHLCSLHIHVRAHQHHSCTISSQTRPEYSSETLIDAVAQIKAFPFEGGCMLRKLVVYSPTLEVWQLLSKEQDRLKSVIHLRLDAWVPRQRDLQKCRKEGMAVSKIICATCPCESSTDLKCQTRRFLKLLGYGCGGVRTLELMDGSLFLGTILNSFASPNMSLRKLVIKRFSSEYLHKHRQNCPGGLESGVGSLKDLEFVSISAAYREKFGANLKGCVQLHTLHLTDVSVDNDMLADVLEECTNLKELSLSNSVVTSCKSIAQLLADTDDETDDEWPTTLCSHSLEVLHLDGQVELPLSELEVTSLQKVVVSGCLPLFSMSRSEEKQLRLLHRGSLLRKYVHHLASLPVEWAEDGVLVLDGRGAIVYQEQAVAPAASTEASEARRYVVPEHYDAGAHANAVVHALSRLSGSSMANGVRALRLEGLSLMPGHLERLGTVFPNVARVELGAGIALGGAGVERGAALVRAFPRMAELEVMPEARVSARSVLTACTAAAAMRRGRPGARLCVELHPGLLAQCREMMEGQSKSAAPGVCIEPGAYGCRGARLDVRSEEEELWELDLVGR